MARTPPARTAGQRPLVAAVALVVLVLAVPQLLAGRDLLTGGGDQVVADDGSTLPDVEPVAGRTAEVVGPPRGALLADYVSDRRQELVGAPPEVDVAVVSFTERLLPQDVQVLLGADVRVHAVLLQLPLETAMPFTVPVEGDLSEDVLAAVARQVEPLAEEEEETRRLLDGGTLGDEAFEAEYRRRLDELVTARQSAQGGTPLVHAVVVQGDHAALLALVDAAAVRLVDPAPVGTDPRASVFHGLLPEDVEVASAGRAP